MQTFTDKIRVPLFCLIQLQWSCQSFPTVKLIIDIRQCSVGKYNTAAGVTLCTMYVVLGLGHGIERQLFWFHWRCQIIFSTNAGNLRCISLA